MFNIEFLLNAMFKFNLNTCDPNLIRYYHVLFIIIICFLAVCVCLHSPWRVIYWVLVRCIHRHLWGLTRIRDGIAFGGVDVMPLVTRCAWPHTLRACLCGCMPFDNDASCASTMMQSERLPFHNEAWCTSAMTQRTYGCEVIGHGALHSEAWFSIFTSAIIASPRESWYL